MNLGPLISGLGTARLGQQQGRQQRQAEEQAKQEQIKQMMFKLALEESARRQTQANTDREYGLRQTESERRLAAEARAAQKEAFAESQARAPVLGTPEYLQAQTELKELEQKFAKPTAPVYGSDEYLRAVDRVERVRDRHQGGGGGSSTPEVVTLPDGTVVQGKPPKITEAQGKAAVNAGVAGAEEASIEAMQTNLPNKYVAKIPVLGNVLTGRANPDFQEQKAAGDRWVNQYLRFQSGAAISESEFENARNQFIPQPGDTQATIAAKASARKRVVEGMRGAAGPATPVGGGTSAQTAFKTASMRLQQQYDNAVAQGANPRMAQAVLDREMTKLRKSFDARE